MTEVANLTAKIGFKISPTEFAQIKNTLKSLQQEIQKAVQEAARFANELTKISRGTGVGGRVVQQFRQLGINASVGANAMDSMLRSTSSLAQKSYWGFTNQLSQWGIYLTRSETAASALMKVMRGASGASPQRQREIFEAAGLPFEEAVLVLEQLQRSGFKLSDAIGMNDEELANMNRVSALIDKIKFNTEGFVNGLVGTQGDTFANGLEMVEGVLGNIQKMILGIARDPGVKSGVANFLNFGALFTGFVSLTEKASDSFKGITQGVAFITKTAIWTTLIALLSRLFLGNRQKIAQTFKKAFPAGAGFLDSLFNSPMLINAVKQAREKLQGVDFFGKESVINYLEDIQKEGFLEATLRRLDDLIDTLIKKLKIFWGSVYNGLLEIIKFFMNEIAITTLTLINEFKQGLGYGGRKIFGDPWSSEQEKKDALERVTGRIDKAIDSNKDLTPGAMFRPKDIVSEEKMFERDTGTDFTNNEKKIILPASELEELASKDPELFKRWQIWAGVPEAEIKETDKYINSLKTRREYAIRPESGSYYDVKNQRFLDMLKLSDFKKVYENKKLESLPFYGLDTLRGIFFEPIQQLYAEFGERSSLLDMFSGSRPYSSEELMSKGIIKGGAGAPVIQITYNSDDTINVNSVDEAMVCQNKDLRSELQSMGNTAIQQWLANIKCAGDL